MKIESVLKLLEQIKTYSSWDDTDSKLDLVLYLDEICGLAIDAIEMLKTEEYEESKVFDFESGN